MARLINLVEVAGLKIPLAGLITVALMATRTEAFPSDSILVPIITIRNRDRYHTLQTKIHRLVTTRFRFVCVYRLLITLCCSILFLISGVGKFAADLLSRGC